MATEPKVVDASALAAILFGEPQAAEVVARLGDAVLFAPTLLRYEIASVCLKKLVAYPKRRRAILKALSFLDEADIQEMQVPAGEVVIMARRNRLTTYDASYLWLARSLDVELVTLDQKLARSAK